MPDWNAGLYLQFEDERTRPARDLLAQVPQRDFVRIADLGCGPGNSTELLVERFHNASITGVDTSPGMLQEARERLPDRTFVQADVAQWEPEPGTDLIFANAVFQWVPDHLTVITRLLSALPVGGVIALQMPDNFNEPTHRLMRETAADGPWASKLGSAGDGRQPLPRSEFYYDTLKPHCHQIDIWRTTYNHPLAGSAAIVDWLKETGLRPFLKPLDPEERRAFLAAYAGRIAEAYPPRIDGKTLLRFPRMFIVAVR